MKKPSSHRPFQKDPDAHAETKETSHLKEAYIISHKPNIVSHEPPKRKHKTIFSLFSRRRIKSIWNTVGIWLILVLCIVFPIILATLGLLAIFFIGLLVSGLALIIFYVILPALTWFKNLRDSWRRY
ncbi:MAG: hypothetical protein ACR2NY_02250 [Alphaproteobacteria bacterium]